MKQSWNLAGCSLEVVKEGGGCPSPDRAALDRLVSDSAAPLTHSMAADAGVAAAAVSPMVSPEMVQEPSLTAGMAA